MVVIVPPVSSIVDKLPIVSVLPAPIVSVPDARLSSLLTVTFAAEAIVAPSDVNLVVTIEPVNTKPDISPNAILSTAMVPAPNSLPDVSVSADEYIPDVSVPNTFNEDVPEKTSLLVIVTTIPVGMITVSVDTNAPGADPPHVSPVLKLPDNIAVYVVAFAALLPRARHSTITHIFLKTLVKFSIVCFFNLLTEKSSLFFTQHLQ